MKMRFSWIIYSCLIFGTGISCERVLQRRQAVPSCPVITDDKFDCSDGLYIEWPSVCDGHKDCPDGTDETKELCAIYEFGTNMTMDCGKLDKTNQVISEEGYQSLNKLTSWSVGIYRFKTESDYFKLCTGSIIAPNIVISVGYPFKNRGIQCKQTPINDGLYKIFGSGTTWEDIIPFENRINITMIYLPGDYNPNAATDGITNRNIAVAVLAKKVSFSNGFAPICIDWFNKYDLQKETQMRTIVVGNKDNFRDKPVNIVMQQFQYTDNSTCLNSYDSTYFSDTALYDIFCIKVNKELGIKSGLVGAGLGILYSNLYFLTGVMFTYMSGENGVKRIDYTAIKTHVSWLRGILNKHVAVNSCVLPPVEGVIYTYEGSNETLSHGTLIDQHFHVIENCEVGYHKVFRFSFRSCLGKGKWLSISDKLCFKMCPPLESDSLDITCRHNGKYVDCSKLSIPDTIAIALCKTSYTAPNGQESEPLELICQTNGTWNKNLYRCTPDCGKVYDVVELILNGTKAPFGSMPWNVGVYKFNEKTSNYGLICGGSIISANLVISAAHCFFQNDMVSRNISIKDAQYKIAIGKYDRNITITDNKYTKILNVSIVYLNEHYDGVTGWHFGDIAIIVLQNRISFSSNVAPVCIDWRDKYNVVNGDQGKIAGWGKTEKGIVSPILLEASLPYIDRNSCRKMYTNGFESYVNADKFCAGFETGQGVSKGDSGAGLSFKHLNVYYLTGVTSVKDPYTNNSIATFTDVKYHIQWIRRLYNEYN